jgi:NADH-quinone oxidoreductase subunit D
MTENTAERTDGQAGRQTGRQSVEAGVDERDLLEEEREETEREAQISSSHDPYGVLGDGEAAEGRVFTASGGDWSEIAEEAASLGEERIVVNMGPQHPSTHGVLRLILEIDGETVTEARAGIGYLHTGIEKNMEFRTWTQGVTFCTRMDYLSPLYQETAYCLAVERLLGITDDVPERATVIRVLLMELNRISSHIVALATGGMEIGALTVMTVGFRCRERVLKLFELITGLRMNHAFIRPGGLAQDLPRGALDAIRAEIPDLRRDLLDVEKLANENPIVKGRLVDVGYLDLTGCMALGITGPVLRSTGLPHDLRKSQPYCGYETYDFEVQTWDTCDSYGRFRIRINEMYESLKIVEQCVDRLEGTVPGPVMVADKKVAWPAQLAIGADGMGNSLEHIREIMGTSMEALIHHFKLVTEGFRVPAGQVYEAVEAPRGELAVHLVSDGGTRPYRAHFRDPSFVNLQATAAMCEGGQVADVVVAVASLDPVMGGVDR